MKNFRNIFILTGAGLSAESGLGTFRDKKGLWSQYDLEDVATPQGFRRNPGLVHEFYNTRRRLHHSAQANDAHKALARLEQNFEGQVLIVTQNIDSLHEQAGSINILHMHGEINKSLCFACGDRQIWTEDLSVSLTCAACQKTGDLRPDVVWFGEMPYHMERIYQALAECDLFLSIGTSGTVYPAAGFLAEARSFGAHTVELNLEPSQGASLFHEAFHGKATEIVPLYVERLLEIS